MSRGAPPLAVLAVVLLAGCGEGKRRVAAATVDTAVTAVSAAPAGEAGDTVRLSPDIPPAPGLADDTSGAPGSGRAVVLAADSAAGDSVYHRKGRCFTCHGDRAGGIPNLGPDLADTVWRHGDGSLASIERTIASGIAAPATASIAMPAFNWQLSAWEIREVASYVYSLAHRGSVVTGAASLGGAPDADDDPPPGRPTPLPAPPRPDTTIHFF